MSDEFTNHRLDRLIKSFTPLTEIDDLEDWVDECGIAPIVHDLMIVCLINARENDDVNGRTYWIDVCNALRASLMEVNQHDIRRRGNSDPQDISGD